MKLFYRNFLPHLYPGQRPPEAQRKSIYIYISIEQLHLPLPSLAEAVPFHAPYAAPPPVHLAQKCSPWGSGSVTAKLQCSAGTGCQTHPGPFPQTDTWQLHKLYSGAAVQGSSGCPRLTKPECVSTK